MSADDPLGNKKNVFTTMLEAVLSDWMKDNMKTSVPGQVLSFDPETQMAQVQIGLKLHTADDQHLDRSPTIYVPVNFWGGTGGTLECKIDRGTEGALFFSQECIDSWVDQGGVAVKSEPRRFSQDDAYFVPGFRSIPGSIKNFANDGIRLRSNDGGQFAWLKGDGSVAVENPAGHIRIGADGTVNINGVTFTPAGLVTSPMDVVAGSISLVNHRTSGVTAGNQISGVPVV